MSLRTIHYFFLAQNSTIQFIPYILQQVLFSTSEFVISPHLPHQLLRLEYPQIITKPRVLNTPCNYVTAIRDAATSSYHGNDTQQCVIQPCPQQLGSFRQNVTLPHQQSRQRQPGSIGNVHHYTSPTTFRCL